MEIRMTTRRKTTSRSSTGARRPHGETRSRRSTAQYSSPACYLHEGESGRSADHEPDIEVRRIYGDAERSGEFRVLVDRLWPRGISKDKAALDAWARELAPSTELREWFGHDPERWGEFRKKYRAELRKHASDLEALRERARHQHVVLLFAARDPQFNHALVLRDALRNG
jgi:uncharacterized protein YeaO (DUF488 family)